MDKYEELVKKQKGILNLPLWIFSGKRLAQRLKLEYEETERLKAKIDKIKMELVKETKDFKEDVFLTLEAQKDKIAELTKRIKKLEEK